MSEIATSEHQMQRIVAGLALAGAVTLGAGGFCFGEVERQPVAVECAGDSLPEAASDCPRSAALILAIKERIAASPLYHLLSAAPASSLPPHAVLTFLERAIDGGCERVSSVARVYTWVTPLSPKGRGQLLGVRVGHWPGDMTKADIAEQAELLLAELESIVQPVRPPPPQ